MPLVISRRPGEALVLETPDGHRITINFRDVDAKGYTRFAIDAPRDVIVFRGEPGAPAHRR